LNVNKYVIILALFFWCLLPTLSSTTPQCSRPYTICKESNDWSINAFQVCIQRYVTCVFILRPASLILLKICFVILSYFLSLNYGRDATQRNIKHVTHTFKGDKHVLKL